MARDRNPLVGTTVTNGYVSVRIRSEHEDPAQAEAMLAAAKRQVNDKVGPLAFGQDDETLQEAAVLLLTGQGKKVTTVESCTGGRIASMLTDVAGSSAVVLGGWVTYANEMKIEQVGVPSQLIEQHGAVSEPVVKAMALGALQRSGADYALSTSGIAGPGGGSQEKPVGTVWIGLAWRESEQNNSLQFLAHLPGDRETIRDRAAKCALQILRLHLLGESLDHMKWARLAGEPVEE